MTFGPGISIHALLAESDPLSFYGKTHTKEFLSTLSLRRATIKGQTIIRVLPVISIHALLAESDALQRTRITISQEFLSTLSLRRATSVAAMR